MSVLKFRDFLVDTFERRLSRDGRHVDVSPRAFDVLKMLVERPGEIVTRDELLGQVWGGAFVEDGNLSVQISKLRRALGESKENRIIETIPGIGYRFLPPAEKIEDAPQVSQGEYYPSTFNDLGHDSEAIRLLLKGRRFFEKCTNASTLKAIECFERSISYDSSNAQAYVGLAAAYIYT